MSLPRARRNPELRAAEALRALGLGTEAPIDVKFIAESHHAEVRAAPLDQDLSGILIRDGQRKIIAVAETHALVRQRYTIAHELGHLLMHPGRPYLAESNQIVRIDRRGGSVPGFADQREEREANQFAAALLMPPDLVLKHWLDLNGTPTVSSLSEMSRRFEVSTLAMKYRLINLGLFSPDEPDDS
ncbi:MAG TPA: ImmA/IrrE family metallo-endopeptidase [Candidatus Baltobacteraceae bacterium]|nr:ImmA/IrrE family metallo-endopeptidase [Candidatus Baltobacteraceae bacterium]